MKSVTKSKLKRNKQVIFKEIDGVVYILNPRNSTIYTLNKTASFIWQSLKVPRSTRELISLLIDNFKVEEKEAKKDLKNFILRCSEDKLLIKI